MPNKNVQETGLRLATKAGEVVPSFAEKKFFTIRFPPSDAELTNEVLAAIEQELPVMAEFKNVPVKGRELLDEVRDINEVNKKKSEVSGRAFKKIKPVWTDGTKIRPHKTYNRRELFKVDILQKLKAARDAGGWNAVVDEVRRLCNLHEQTINEMKSSIKVGEFLTKDEIKTLEEIAPEAPDTKPKE
jgi:hypothetical protein